MYGKNSSMVGVVVIIALILGTATIIYKFFDGEVPQVAEQQQVEVPLTEQAYWPSPTNYVVDDAQVLTPEFEAEMTEKLKAFDKTAQIALITITTTAPLEINDYSIRLAEKWKVGYAGIDNGVIVLVAMNDRKVRIEVGKGAEGKITDAEAGRILDEVVLPRFAAGDFQGGLRLGLSAIQLELTK